MPKSETSWVNVTIARLMVRRCAYWVSLQGLPDLPDGQESKTVEIPIANVFDVDALKTLMDKSRKGIPL
jgi:Domain of unknown function (DUF4365)